MASSYFWRSYCVVFGPQPVDICCRMRAKKCTLNALVTSVRCSSMISSCATRKASRIPLPIVCRLLCSDWWQAFAQQQDLRMSLLKCLYGFGLHTVHAQCSNICMYCTLDIVHLKSYCALTFDLKWTVLKNFYV